MCVLVLLYMCPPNSYRQPNHALFCCWVCGVCVCECGCGCGCSLLQVNLHVCCVCFRCCNVSMFHVARVFVWVCGCVRGHIIPHTHTHTHYKPVLYVSSYCYLCPHPTIWVLILLYIAGGRRHWATHGCHTTTGDLAWWNHSFSGVCIAKLQHRLTERNWERERERCHMKPSTCVRVRDREQDEVVGGQKLQKKKM
jgi:hypothetical protein